MKRCWAVCLVALITEALAITWRWGSAPTHTVRDWYEGSFETYFVDSFTPWFIIFTGLTLILLLVGKLRDMGQGS